MCVLVSSLTLISSAWAQPEHVFYDKDLGVSLSVPTGWSKDSKQPIGESVLVNFERDVSEIVLQSFAINESATKEMQALLSEAGFDLLGYVKLYLSKTDWVAKSVEEPKKVIIGNKEGVVSLSEESVLGLMLLKVLDYAFYDSKRIRVYHLRLYSPEKAFETDKPEFLSVVNSFTIK